MKTPRVPVNNLASLRLLLADADALLLDFDGPICSVFAGLPAPVVAEQLREAFIDEFCDVPAEIQKSDDPFDIFTFAASIGAAEARYVEAAFRAQEVEAIKTAEPTSGALDLIQSWCASGRKLAIVSNNSVATVESYLHLHQMEPYVHCISARTELDPSLLKPNPILLNMASAQVHVPPDRCVLVGDSTTDIQAARNADMPTISYANKAGKVEAHQMEGPSLITTDLAYLVRSLH